MSGGDQQIIALFELNNCSPEQIAEATGYDLISVQTCLMSFSSVYRKQQGALSKTPGPKTQQLEAPTPDVTDEDFDMLKQAAMGIALRGDPESPTTARMIRFLWNEKKGRNDTAKGSIVNVKTNIVMINQGILQAREAVQRALGAPTIDVESSDVTSSREENLKVA